MQPTLFITSNLLALAVSAQLAELFLAGREPWRRLLLTLAAFPIVVLATVLTLGSLGFLTPLAASAVMVILFVLLTIVRRGRIAGLWPARPGRLWGEAEPGLLWPLPIAMVGASWVYLAASTCLKGTRLGMDDLSYHAAGPAQWLLDGRISLAPFNYHAYYPFNTECLSLWFMLPWHADVFASLSGLYWSTLAVVAIIALGLSLGRSRSAATLPAAIALVPPVIVHQVTGTFCAVDFAAPVAVLAGLALMAPGADAPLRPRDALLGGLMVGYAAGAKASLLAIAVVPLVWLIVRAWSSRRWALPFAYALSAFAAGGFWYMRNWWLTGNPIFPLDVGPFAGPMDSAARDYLSLMHWITDPAADCARWWFIGSSHLLWPLLPGLAALLGWFAGVYGLWRRRREGPTSPRALLQVLFATGLFFLVLYPFTPCTGTWGGPAAGAELGIRLRYAILPFLIGLVMLPELFPQHRVGRASSPPTGPPESRPRQTPWLVLTMALAYAAVLHGWAVGSAAIYAVLLGALLVLNLRLLGRPLSRLMGTLRQPLPGWLLLALLLGGLSAWAPRKQFATAQVVRSLGTLQQPVGHAWDAVNALPDGSRIAWFGPEAWRYYPLYGRRLQHQPVPVIDNGSPWRPLHEWWPEIEGDWWQYPANQTFAQMGLPADTTGLVDNLLAAGVQYVFVTGWEDNELPVQHSILERSGRAEIVYVDICSAIWRLKP